MFKVVSYHENKEEYIHIENLSREKALKWKDEHKKIFPDLVLEIKQMDPFKEWVSDFEDWDQDYA